MVEYCTGNFATQLMKDEVQKRGYELLEDPDLCYWSVALDPSRYAVAVSELVSSMLRQIKEFRDSGKDECMIELPMAEFVPKFKKLLKAWGLTYCGKTACSEYYLITKECLPVNVTYDYIRKETDFGKELVC